VGEQGEAEAIGFLEGELSPQVLEALSLLGERAFGASAQRLGELSRGAAGVEAELIERVIVVVHDVLGVSRG
jgi:hypothetical protein